MKGDNELFNSKLKELEEILNTDIKHDISENELKLVLYNILKECLVRRDYELHIGDYTINLTPQKLGVIFDNDESHVEISNDDFYQETERYTEVRFFVIDKDPNKEYDEEEVKEAMKSLDIYDLMSIIKDEYSVGEIISNLDTDDIFQCIDDSEMLDYLDGTYELDDHDDEVRTRYHNDVLEDIINKLERDYTEYNKNIQNWPADELHRFICDIAGCSYYDSSVIEQLKEKLNNNSYIKNYK